MKILFSLCMSLSMLLLGCSDEQAARLENDASLSGMVESQAQAMQKARALDGVLQDADKKRREEAGQ